MIQCNHRHDGKDRPVLAEVARLLAGRMVPPKNADLPTRLAELVAALLAHDGSRGDHRPGDGVRRPDDA